MIDLLLGFTPLQILIGLGLFQGWVIFHEAAESRQDARDSAGYLEDAREQLRQKGRDG